MSQSDLSPAAASLVAAHAAFLEARSADPAWLLQAREDGITRFAQQDLPTTRDEAWKYTNLRSTRGQRFSLSQPGAGGWDAASVAPLWIDALQAAARLVFVDGRYQPALSQVGELPQGVEVGSLAQAMAADHPLVQEHLTRVADGGLPFVALNDAFFEDGAFISVPRAKALEAPVVVLNLASQGQRGVFSAARHLVVLGEIAQASLIEIYVGQEGAHLINTVTEMVLGQGAHLKQTRLQQEGAQDVHVFSGRALQERDSQYEGRTYWLGGELVRNDFTYTLQGEGVHCASDSTYVVRDKQHVDNHTVVDHAKPHGSSHQLCKGLLMDQGRGVFQGKVIVRQDAQKTDARQSNPNLVLSPRATADTRPQLEIYADDVRCTHGAAVGGELDPDGLFYLRSRGFSLKEARRILARAFVYELVEAEPLEEVRDHLDGVLQAVFGQGEV